jgi:hypothetical protein
MSWNFELLRVFYLQWAHRATAISLRKGRLCVFDWCLWMVRKAVLSGYLPRGMLSLCLFWQLVPTSSAGFCKRAAAIHTGVVSSSTSAFAPSSTTSLFVDLDLLLVLGGSTGGACTSELDEGTSTTGVTGLFFLAL